MVSWLVNPVSQIDSVICWACFMFGWSFQCQ